MVISLCLVYETLSFPFLFIFFFYKKYTKIGVEISIHVP